MKTSTARSLTKQQRKLLEFIGTRIILTGVQPSYREIAGHFGFAAPNGVVCHISALARKGYIARPKGRGRSIQINWSRLGLTADERMVKHLTERFLFAVRLRSEE